MPISHTPLLSSFQDCDSAHYVFDSSYRPTVTLLQHRKPDFPGDGGGDIRRSRELVLKMSWLSKVPKGNFQFVSHITIFVKGILFKSCIKFLL